MRAFIKLVGLAAFVSLMSLLVGCAGPSGPMNIDSLGASGGVSSKTISRGRAFEVGRFLHWDGNCWADTIPDVKIVKRPKFGSVSVARGNFEIPTSICKGIPIKGAKLTYRGHRRGVDEFSYRVTSGPRAGVHTVRLTIK